MSKCHIVGNHLSRLNVDLRIIITRCILLRVLLLGMAVNASKTIGICILLWGKRTELSTIMVRKTFNLLYTGNP